MWKWELTKKSVKTRYPFLTEDSDTKYALQLSTEMTVFLKLDTHFRLSWSVSQGNNSKTKFYLIVMH